MKQGRLVFGREIRRGPEKGRGWLALSQRDRVRRGGRQRDAKPQERRCRVVQIRALGLGEQTCTGLAKRLGTAQLEVMAR